MNKELMLAESLMHVLQDNCDKAIIRGEYVFCPENIVLTDAFGLLVSCGLATRHGVGAYTLDLDALEAKKGKQ